MDDSQQDQFVALMVRSQPRIFSFITTLLPRPNDADDVYQQTCIRLWEKRDRYDPSRDFLRWAYGFARREVLKHLERRRGHGVQLSPAMIAELAEAQREPDAIYEARRDALNRCLDKLPDRQQHLVKQCYLGEEPKKTIARQLHISLDALYMRLSRVRRVLFECVSQTLAREEQA